MTVLVQMISGLLGVVAVSLLLDQTPPHAPAFVYVVAAGLSAWLGTYLYARWKHGRGVNVTPSRPK